MNKLYERAAAKIDQLTKQARAFMDGENKDTAKAKELMDQVDDIRQEYELEKRIYEQEKAENVPAESEHQVEKKLPRSIRWPLL